MTLAFEAVRQRLQQMEFYTSLSPIIIKKSGLLDHGGLRLIFENQVQGVDFPHDIRADADLLFRKWMGGQIDPHLFRGIVTKSGTAKADRGFKSHSIQPDYPGRVSCNYVGAGNLVNGQWWPLQMCAKRDGAHGEIEAGIHGQVGHFLSQGNMQDSLTLSIERQRGLLRCGEWGWLCQCGQRQLNRILRYPRQSERAISGNKPHARSIRDSTTTACTQISLTARYQCIPPCPWYPLRWLVPHHQPRDCGCR